MTVINNVDPLYASSALIDRSFMNSSMFSSRTDTRVLGYLGRALSLELSGVQLYATQARLVETWGLNGPAEKLRAESREELGHADRIIARMLGHGVAPNASQLRPVKLGRDLAELLLIDQAFEQDLIRLYSDAVRHCARAGLRDDRMFFEGLLQEEQEHACALAAWLAELGHEP